MERKRDGLVPIGEALADLPGPGEGSPTLTPGAALFHRWPIK